MSLSNRAIAPYTDDPQPPVAGSQHTFDSNVISENSQVHFGDLHQYSYNRYSISEARDTIYHNTLATTFRSIVSHQSMRGWTRYIPLFSIFYDIAAGSVMLKIQKVEGDVQRLQDVEQTFIANTRESPDAMQAFFSTEEDQKVQRLRMNIAKLLPKVQQTAQRCCTDRQSVVCPDEFCDLVGRLDTQIRAREDMKSVIGKLQHAQRTPEVAKSKESLNAADSENAASSEPRNDSNRAHETHVPYFPPDQQEYLYANQDFWRQLNIVLSSMLKLQQQAWFSLTRTIFTALLIFLGVSNCMRWLMETMIPSEFKDQPNVMPEVFATMITSFYLLVTYQAGKNRMRATHSNDPIKLGAHGNTHV